MPIVRLVQAEALDNLPAQDPRAHRARRDLRRVHRVMGTPSLVTAALLRALAARSGPMRWIEIGAGDGSLLLSVAARVASRWPDVHLTLLDREPAVTPATLHAFGRYGWTAEVLKCDVLDWIESPGSHHELVVANLFLHHFEPATLRRLLAGVGQRTDALVACEPRRSRFALAGSHLVGLLGASAVTRQDAVLSVHAGFRGEEVSAAWPAVPGWRLDEYEAGPFSHCFIARRVT